MPKKIKYFVNIRIIKAEDLEQAKTDLQNCEANFDDYHELSDIIIPIENLLIKP